MENEGIRLLDSLIRLDVDAVHAYDTAIAVLNDDKEAQNKLRAFKSDHERHVRELSAQVTQLGGTPTKATPNPKDFHIPGFNAIRGSMGVEPALKAMRLNEELVNRTYADALKSPAMPAAVRDLVQRNYEDEKRHLQWITNRIGQKVGAGT